MTSELVTAIVSILTTLGLRDVIPGVWRRLTGRTDEVRAENRQLRAEIDVLEARVDQLREERDREAGRTRITAEYASLLRRIMFDHGLAGEVPPWPGQEKKP